MKQFFKNIFHYIKIFFSISWRRDLWIAGCAYIVSVIIPIGFSFFSEKFAKLSSTILSRIFVILSVYIFVKVVIWLIYIILKGFVQIIKKVVDFFWNKNSKPNKKTTTKKITKPVKKQQTKDIKSNKVAHKRK